MKLKLKPEIKKLWTKALKSGNYKQGKRALCTVTDKGLKHCCLGVLCDIHRTKVLKKGHQVWKNSNSHVGMLDYLDNCGVLPVEVVEWAFDTKKVPVNVMIHSNPDVDHEKGSCLSKINDNGCTFEEIAEVIEKQL